MTITKILCSNSAVCYFEGLWLDGNSKRCVAPKTHKCPFKQIQGQTKLEVKL